MLIAHVPRKGPVRPELGLNDVERARRRDHGVERVLALILGCFLRYCRTAKEIFQLSYSLRRSRQHSSGDGLGFLKLQTDPEAVRSEEERGWLRRNNRNRKKESCGPGRQPKSSKERARPK